MSAVAVNDPATVADEIEAVKARLAEIVQGGDKSARDEIPALHDRLRELHGALGETGARVPVELPTISRADELALEIERRRAEMRRLPVPERLADVRLLHEELNQLEPQATREWNEAQTAAHAGFEAWRDNGEGDRAPYYSGRLTQAVEDALWERFSLSESGLSPMQEADAAGDIDVRIAELRAADRAAELQRRADAMPKEPGWELREAIEAAEARIAELSDDPDRADDLARARTDLGELRRQEAEAREEAARETRRAEVEARREAEAQAQAARDTSVTADAEYAQAFEHYLAVAIPAFEVAASKVFEAHRKRAVAAQGAGGRVGMYAHLPIIRLAIRALLNAGATLGDVEEFDYTSLMRINQDYPAVAATEPEPKARPNCSVCARDDVEAINQALVDGASLRKVEEAYGAPRATLSLHRRECIDGAARAMKWSCASSDGGRLASTNVGNY